MSNTISFYFHASAFKAAFKSNNSSMIITTDGSVYKDSVSRENLVVSASGEVGQAGGAPFPVRINDMNMGAIASSVEYTCRLGTQFVDSINLEKAVSEDLDWIATNIYDLPRRAGEVDPELRDRIRADIFAIKETGPSIINVLTPFADKVEIDQDVSSGAFSDVSFSNYYKEFDVPEIVRGAIAGATGGLVFHYDLILTNPDLSRKDEIIRLVKDYTVGGVEFNIFVK